MDLWRPKEEGEQAGLDRVAFELELGERVEHDLLQLQPERRCFFFAFILGRRTPTATADSRAPLERSQRGAIGVFFERSVPTAKAGGYNTPEGQPSEKS